MATAPVRPRAYASWLKQVTDTSPAPPDASRSALALFGVSQSLFSRWCPSVLSPELCRRQTFDSFTPDIWDRLDECTQLVLIRNCLVADVWRDRTALLKALETVHIVLFFDTLRAETPPDFLAGHVGMTAEGSGFLCVFPSDMRRAKDEGVGGDAAPAAQPHMMLDEVEASSRSSSVARDARELVLRGVAPDAAWRVANACERLRYMKRAR